MKRKDITGQVFGRLKAAVLFAGGGVLDAAIMQYADKGLSVRLAVEGDPNDPQLSNAIADTISRKA